MQIFTSDIEMRKDSKLRKEKVGLSQMNFWDSNTISKPTECDSSCTNVDAKSHESLQQKQFTNEAVLHVIQ